MIKAVIIDLDDTLCLTEAVCFEMENDVLRAMGREPMSREIHVSTWGKPLFEIIPVRSPGVNVAEFEKHYPAFIAKYITEGRLDAIPPENLAALDQLMEAGKELMVLTSRTHTELRHMLEPDHLLAQRIKAFYYRDVMQFAKPDPRAFDELLRDHKYKPEECLYIGDSLSDAQAAKQAGLHFVASLESGLRTREDFADEPVDAFVETFPGLIGAVQVLDRQ